MRCQCPFLLDTLASVFASRMISDRGEPCVLSKLELVGVSTSSSGASSASAVFAGFQQVRPKTPLQRQIARGGRCFKDFMTQRLQLPAGDYYLVRLIVSAQYLGAISTRCIVH